MESTQLTEFLKTGVTAARLAGDIILKNLGQLSKEDIQTKQASDFVTKVDRWSEAVILQTIRNKFPAHSFLAEETLKQDEKENFQWIIDPLAVGSTTVSAEVIGFNNTFPYASQAVNVNP